MKRAFAMFMLSVMFVIPAGAAYACNHDILCPDQWIWSDLEGTCVEDTPPGM